MKYPVYDQSGEQVGEHELNPAIFEVKPKEAVVHQVVVAQAANARQVLAHTKDRSEVAGGGRKPWRQKGTGRARHGSIRSPLWRGGGVTFGPQKDRNFAKKINKKVKRQALFMVLTDKAQNGDLVLVDVLDFPEAKTKRFFEFYKNFLQKVRGKQQKKQSGTKALIIAPETDDHLIRASRNMREISVIRADSLNVVDLINSNFLIVPVKSLKLIEETYKL